MRKINGYWTNERVFAEARKYKTRNEFQKGCPGAYNAAKQKGLLKVMTWLKYIRKPNDYWTKERIFAEARKYETRAEFQKGCTTAYQIAHKKGWLDEMTWFVDGRVKKYSNKNDSVYKYYFDETNSIYIGRTLMHRQKIRHNDHSTSEKDAVFIHAKENGLAIPPMEIIEENITPIEGLEREDYWVNYYKEKGYNVLNKAKTGIGSGALGRICSGKWTYETCYEEAMKYSTRGEFEEGCGSAYNVSLKNKWLNDYVWFKEIRKPKNYWTKERVFEEARKYKTRSELKYYSCRAYNIARKNKWLDELFPKYKIAS